MAPDTSVDLGALRLDRLGVEDGHGPLVDEHVVAVPVRHLKSLHRRDPPVRDGDPDLDHPEPRHDRVAVEGARLRQVRRVVGRIATRHGGLARSEPARRRRVVAEQQHQDRHGPEQPHRDPPHQTNLSTWIRSGSRAGSDRGGARVLHPLRVAAEVDVTLGHVRDQVHERLDVVEVLRRHRQPAAAAADARPRHRHDPRAAFGRQRGQLVPEQHVGRRVDPVDEDDVAGSLGQPFEERPHRGDPDARRHQQHLVAGPDAGVQPSVRAFDEDPRAAVEVVQTRSSRARRGPP